MKIWNTLSTVFNKISTFLQSGYGRFLSSPFVNMGLSLLIVILFLIVPMRSAQSDCGISGRAGKTYSFVHTDMVQEQADYAPYLMGYGIIHDFYALEKRDPQIDDNIREWKGRFCDIPDSADIDKVIYDSDIDQLVDLREATGHKDRDVYYQLQYNTFAQVIKENGCTDVVDYLIYAKNCEKYCVIGEEWSDKPRDVAQMFFWINTGRQQFKKTSSYFLKLRYAYQMIRLAHYAKDYQAVLSIYNDVMPKTEKINSIINYWILAHKAGALRALGKRAEAAYLFAVVFRYCPSKRRQAFESFDIKTEREWQECLNFCRDDKERGALYAIRASYDKAKALEDLKELYRLDPTNEHLELLLMRETLRLEKTLLGYSFRRSLVTDRAVLKKNIDYCLDLQAFVKKVADEKTVKNPPLWRITEGYLGLLVGDWQYAMKTFVEARKLTKNPVLVEQIDAFDLAARIIGLQGVDFAMDSTMNNIRVNNAFLSDTDFDGLFYEKVGSIYQRLGNSGIAYMCQYGLQDLEKNPQLRLIDDLIALCKKPDKTLFEREMVMKNSVKTIETQLWDIKARYHLARFEMEAANECFKRIPNEERGKRYAAFLDNLNDCVNCIQTDTALYNRAEFTQEMLYLEYQIRVSPNMIMADSLYYKLGLGYFNMTYFGNSSGIADFYRSGKSWDFISRKGNVYPLTGFPNGNYEVTDVSLALENFEKARQLTPNRELQAKCAFWCAKCEQILFYLSADNHYTFNKKIAPTVPPQYRRYFKLLKEHYYDTDFYKQAATECKYFKYYLVK